MKCADLPVINIKIECLSFHGVFELTITIKANARGYNVHGLVLVSQNHRGKLGKLKRTKTRTVCQSFETRNFTKKKQAKLQSALLNNRTFRRIVVEIKII